VLTENVDATDGDVISSMFVRGNFQENKLIGLDADAIENMNGKSIEGFLFI